MRPALWLGTVAVGLVAYLYSLDGFYIPHIGDEAPYIEIARLTAESGELLPLRTAPGLEDTKPPLLFWLGILATNWGESFTLLRLRLAILFFTFATALLVFAFARRAGANRGAAGIAALTFLGFGSSFQYGRPFLTNLPETFFVFASFTAVAAFPEANRRFGPWLASGALLALACLVKSFALAVPVGLALALVVLVQRGFSPRRMLREDLWQVALAAGLGVAGFCLWPLLDPDPTSVLRNFVLEENLGKIESSGYLHGLVSGPYALYRLWLGPFANAGLFAVALGYLAVVSFRNRRVLTEAEKCLWALVLAFLFVYSLPSQRQENYLIPTTPALAVLLGLRWRAIPPRWFRAFSLPGAVGVAALLVVMFGIRDRALPPGAYRWWELAVPLVALAIWGAILAAPSRFWGGFHAAMFLSLLSIACGVGPFEGPLGRFEPDRVRMMRRRAVFVPTEFVSRYERYRFLLPGARVEGYDPANANTVSQLLDSGRLVIVHRELGESVEGPFRIFASRFDLRSRQTTDEMFRIVFEGELDLLVRRELVLRRHRLDRMIGEP